MKLQLWQEEVNQTLTKRSHVHIIAYLFPICCTCANIVADAIHRDGGISDSASVWVLHHPFDPTMHLRATSMTNVPYACINPFPTRPPPNQHLLHNSTQWILYDVRVECIIHDVHFHSKARYHFISFEPDYRFKYRAASQRVAGTSGPLHHWRGWQVCQSYQSVAENLALFGLIHLEDKTF